MATALLYATTHLGGTFTNPNNAIGNTPSTWAGLLNENTSETSRWAIGTVAEPLTPGATHTVRVLMRKGSNSGNPTATVTLYKNGSVIATLANGVTVSSTTGQVVTGTFTTAQIIDRNNIEVEVSTSSAGGNPNTRNSVQVAYIEAELDYVVPEPPQTAPTLSLITASYTNLNIGWTQVDGANTYELQRDGVTVYTGSDSWFLDTGLDDGTQYTYRVRGANSEGPGPWSSNFSPSTLAYQHVSASFSVDSVVAVSASYVAAEYVYITIESLSVDIEAEQTLSIGFEVGLSETLLVSMGVLAEFTASGIFEATIGLTHDVAVVYSTAEHAAATLSIDNTTSVSASTTALELVSTSIWIGLDLGLDTEYTVWVMPPGGFEFIFSPDLNYPIESSLSIAHQKIDYDTTLPPIVSNKSLRTQQNKWVTVGSRPARTGA